MAALHQVITYCDYDATDLFKVIFKASIDCCMSGVNRSFGFYIAVVRQCEGRYNYYLLQSFDRVNR
jgi:hypothetical protein